MSKYLKGGLRICRRNETRVNGLSINESDHERGGVRTRYIMHNAGRQEVQDDLAGAGDGRGERGEGRMNESSISVLGLQHDHVVSEFQRP